MKATVVIDLPNNFNRGDCLICPYLCDLVRDDRGEEKCPLRIKENSNIDEILKKIDGMIHNTEELLNEFEKNERLEVKLRTLLTAKEIIQSEQKEKTNFDIVTESPVKMINYFLTLLRRITDDNDLELDIGSKVIERLLDYLNQPLESEE